MEKKRLSPVAITGIVIAVIAVILGIYGISTYNGLAKENQEVTAQWSQVENVMQRRADLIPNLVNAVKGEMKQEQKIIDSVTAARANYNKANTTTGKAAADAQINQSVGTLLTAIQENYPNLKSNQNVSDLMVQLEGSENRIATERQRYITAVKVYNQAVVTFPKNLFAGMMGLGQKPTFKANPSAKEVPKVNLE